MSFSPRFKLFFAVLRLLGFKGFQEFGLQSLGFKGFRLSCKALGLNIFRIHRSCRSQRTCDERLILIFTIRKLRSQLRLAWLLQQT